MNQPHFLTNRDKGVVSDPTLRSFRSSKRGGGIRGMGFFSPRVMGALSSGHNLSHCPTPVPSTPTMTHRGMPLFGKDAVAAASSMPIKKSRAGGLSTTRVYTKSDRATFLAAERERNATENMSMPHAVAPSSLPSNAVSPSVPHIGITPPSCTAEMTLSLETIYTAS